MSAGAARALLAKAHDGVLATCAADGAPLSTFVACADDGAGRPLFLFSGLSEHTRNLEHDARASLLILGPREPEAAPMDRARVTLSGRISFLQGDDASQARATFIAATPGAEGYAQLPDFRPARLELRSVRYVGGFARAVTVALERYFAGQ